MGVSLDTPVAQIVRQWSRWPTAAQYASNEDRGDRQQLHLRTINSFAGIRAGAVDTYQEKSPHDREPPRTSWLFHVELTRDVAGDLQTAVRVRILTYSREFTPNVKAATDSDGRAQPHPRRTLSVKAKLCAFVSRGARLLLYYFPLAVIFRIWHPSAAFTRWLGTQRKKHSTKSDGLWQARNSVVSHYRRIRADDRRETQRLDTEGDVRADACLIHAGLEYSATRSAAADAALLQRWRFCAPDLASRHCNTAARLHMCGIFRRSSTFIGLRRLLRSWGTIGENIPAHVLLYPETPALSPAEGRPHWVPPRCSKLLSPLSNTTQHIHEHVDGGSKLLPPLFNVTQHIHEHVVRRSPSLSPSKCCDIHAVPANSTLHFSLSHREHTFGDIYAVRFLSRILSPRIRTLLHMCP
ncbi:unnamed protein product [Rangifer tarandus platyrhynchus]|uniref:Uncharacterized protein n=1 Tax=Rangifer tarandus platyrhynchus TaxID=3082113 RepID=A0ABN8XJ26_RANTA|nr:unnamed protein product [Rangifer tarandus platyrhynchus]